MARTKAQLSLEFMAITALLLVVVAILFARSTTVSSDSFALERLQKATDLLARTADKVNSLGPGSTATVFIELPNGVVAQSAENGLVLYDLNTSKGTVSVYSETVAERLAGRLPVTPGQHRVTLSLLSNGTLVIGTGFYADPESASYTFVVGGSQSRDFTLFNYTGASVSGITYTVSGDINNPDWTVTVSGLAASLASDANDAFQVTISASGAIPSGTYRGVIDVNGLNSSTLAVENAKISSIVVVTVIPPISCTFSASTYSDSTCSTADVDFNQGDRVWVKALADSCTVTDGKIEWVNTLGVAVGTSSNNTINNSTGVCRDYNSTAVDLVGVWQARVTSPSNQAFPGVSVFAMSSGPLVSCSLTPSTYNDLLCLTPDSNFLQGETVYMKAVTSSALCTVTDGNFAWINPVGIVRQTQTGVTITSAGSTCHGYATLTSDRIGTWTARASSVSGAASTGNADFNLNSACNLTVATFSNSACTIADSSFSAGERVWAKATASAGCSITDGNISWRNPSGTVVFSSNNNTINSAGVCRDYNSSVSDANGTWTVVAKSDGNTVNAGSTTFALSGACRLSSTTHSDSSCLVALSDFNKGQTVYIRAITDTCTINDGNLAWINPLGVTRSTNIGNTITPSASVCRGYTTLNSDVNGRWTARSSSPSGAAATGDANFNLNNCLLFVSTHSDSSCSTADNDFNKGYLDGQVFVKSRTNGCTVTDGNIEWVDPSGVVRRSVTGQAIGAGGVCRDMNTYTFHQSGTWTARSSSVSGAALTGSAPFTLGGSLCSLSVATYDEVGTCSTPQSTFNVPQDDPDLLVTIGPYSGCQATDVNVIITRPNGTVEVAYTNVSVTNASSSCQDNYNTSNVNGTWRVDANSFQADNGFTTFTGT